MRKMVAQMKPNHKKNGLVAPRSIRGYKVVDELEDNSFVVLKKSEVSFYKKQAVRLPQDKPRLYLLKKYELEENREEQWRPRINSLHLLSRKQMVHLHESFFIVDRQSHQQYFCTVEQLSGYQTIRSYMWHRIKRRVDSNREFSCIDHQSIRCIMKAVLDTLETLHEIRIAYGSLSPLSILIEKKTRAIVLRPLDIIQNNGVWTSCECVDPYTFRLHRKKSTVIQFEQSQMWYFPPEVISNPKDGGNYFSIHCDLWAVACILAECLLPYPLFSSEDIPNQLITIYSTLGMPSRKYCPKPITETGFFDSLKGVIPTFSSDMDRLRSIKRFISLSNVHVTTKVVHLLGVLLQYKPEKRLDINRVRRSTLFTDDTTVFYELLKYRLNSQEATPKQESDSSFVSSIENSFEDHSICSLSPSFLSDVAALNGLDERQLVKPRLSDEVPLTSLLNGYDEKGANSTSLETHSRKLLSTKTVTIPKRKELFDYDYFMFSENDGETIEPVGYEPNESAADQHSRLDETADVESEAKQISDIHSISTVDDSLSLPLLSQRMKNECRNIQVVVLGIKSVTHMNECRIQFLWDDSQVTTLIVDSNVRTTLRSTNHMSTRWMKPLILNFQSQTGETRAHVTIDVSLLGIGETGFEIDGWYHVICDKTKTLLGQIQVQVSALHESIENSEIVSSSPSLDTPQSPESNGEEIDELDIDILRGRSSSIVSSKDPFDVFQIHQEEESSSDYSSSFSHKEQRRNSDDSNISHCSSLGDIVSRSVGSLSTIDVEAKQSNKPILCSIPKRSSGELTSSIQEDELDSSSMQDSPFYQFLEREVYSDDEDDDIMQPFDSNL